jgi:RHH-type proline utilization regulon transcriptional repressor/proline dehydrogenase/delta 1-pyrroline-5-carboxylate dehydrogenase
MRMMGEIFVMGRTIEEAIARMKKRENRGFTASFDMLGEAARTFPDAERYFRSYEDAIRAVGKVAERGAFHLGQAVRAPPALRSRAI